MKKVVSFVVFTVMSLVAVFAATPAQAEEATLTVNVTDDNGAPVEGAFVTLYVSPASMEAETNAEGVAKITGIDSETVSGKTITVSVDKEMSHADAEADFTTTLNPVVNVTLTEPKFTITIHVVTGDFDQVAGATVTILGKDYFTDDKGLVEIPNVPLSALDLESGEIPYSVYKDGYEPYDGVIALDNDSPSGVAILKASEATATIKVYTGEDYDPVEGVKITFMEQTYTTGENGEVVVKEISAPDVIGKEIPFTAYKDGYEEYHGTVNFTEGFDGYGQAALVAEKASLTVTVNTGEDNDPIEGATVSFQGNDYTTDENGRAFITNLSAPDFIGKEVPFTAYKDGYEFYEGKALFDMLEAQAIATLIPEEATLTIKVVTGEDQDPVEGATVTFQDEKYTTGENGQVTITGISAPEVIMQEVDYTVYKDGYDFYEGKAFFDVLEAQAIAPLVPAEAILKIKVVTGEDQDPVAGATVTVEGKQYFSDQNGEANIPGIKFLDVIGKTLPYTVYKDGYDEFTGEADFTESMEAYPIATLVAAEATVTIKVYTGEENDPVADAMVTFMDQDYTTDENGEVKISVSAPDVIGKEIPFTAYKDGYEFFEGIVNFDVLEAWGIAELVSAQATISIKVTTGEENDPVEGATVTVDGKEYTTNENGEVKITGLNGPDVIGTTIPVTIAKEGFKTVETVADFSETLDALIWEELEPEEGSINAINAAIAGSKVYDLQGRVITAPRKGQVYIVNGCKVRI